MIIHDRNVRQLSWLPLPSSLTTDRCLCTGRTAGHRLHCWRKEKRKKNTNVSNVHTCSLICLFICFSVEISVSDYRRCAAVKTTLDKINSWPIYTQGTAGQQRQLLSLLNWRSKHAPHSPRLRTSIEWFSNSRMQRHFIATAFYLSHNQLNLSNWKRKWRSAVRRVPGPCALKKINLITVVRQLRRTTEITIGATLWQ